MSRRQLSDDPRVTYEIKGKIVTVFFGDKSKPAQLGTFKDNPETLVRLLASELGAHAK